MHSRLAAALAALTLLISSAPAPATASVSAMAAVARLDSGTVQPGESTSLQVDASPYPGMVLEATLLPYVSRGTQPCRFRLDRTWYDQRWGGPRLFRITVTNIGGIACGTEVVVGTVKAHKTWSATINAGTEQGWHMNNANPLTMVYLAGVTPRGTSETRDCQIQITRTWYVQQPSGEREFHFRARNTGSASCTVDIMLARKQHLGSTPPERPELWLNPGDATILFPNYPPEMADEVLVPGLIPWGHEDERTCRMEISSRTFLGYASGQTGITYQVKNIGSTLCGYHPLYTSLN